MKVDGLKQTLKEMDKLKHKISDASGKALGRVSEGVKTETSREVRTRYNIKNQDIKEEVKIRNSGGGKIKIFAKGPNLPTIKFSPSPNKPTVGKRSKPVKVAVRKGGAKKRIPGAFPAKMRSGHIGIFKRSAKKSLPIEEIKSPAVPVMANNRDIIKRIEIEAEARMEKRMDHEIKQLLK